MRYLLFSKYKSGVAIYQSMQGQAVLERSLLVEVYIETFYASFKGPICYYSVHLWSLLHKMFPDATTLRRQSSAWIVKVHQTTPPNIVHAAQIANINSESAQGLTYRNGLAYFSSALSNL